METIEIQQLQVPGFVEVPPVDAEGHGAWRKYDEVTREELDGAIALAAGKLEVEYLLDLIRLFEWRFECKPKGPAIRKLKAALR